MEGKTLTIRGVSTLVTFTGEGKPLLCLHGWGASHESFTELRAALEGAPVQIIVPDLPGFGKTDDPSHAWSIDDYADFIEELVEQLCLQDVLLLGHSFGGRIAIKLSARKAKWISHLYLCAAAGLRQKRYAKRLFGYAVSKVGDKVLSVPGFRWLKEPSKKLLYTILCVHDFENVSGVMQEAMAKVIEEDLSDYLAQITVSTDLFWGTDDRMTPIGDSKFMNNKIVHSKLHTFPGVRHRVHRDRAKEIAETIKQKL